MTLTADDVNWILLGFRLGQLTDVCDQQGRNDDRDEELVGSLIANLEINATKCINTPNVQPVVSLIKEIGGTWRDRESLAREDGTGKPYELIYGACARLERTIRQTIQSSREETGFKVGLFLGQSHGWYGAAEETCWCYRNLTDLMRELAKLEATLTEISDLPEINHAEELRGFASTHSKWRETRKRYPRHRWGWAFIEDRLAQSADPLEPESLSDGNHKQTQAEETNEAGIPMKYITPLTPHQRKIVGILWGRKHGMTFRSLMEIAWKDKKKTEISDEGILKALNRIKERWVEYDILEITLIISKAATVKLDKPEHKAAGED